MTTPDGGCVFCAIVAGAADARRTAQQVARLVQDRLDADGVTLLRDRRDTTQAP